MADWQEANCPFCDVGLEVIGGSAEILADTLSLQLPWPKGEKVVVVGKANGYLAAQVLKAALEAEGIPVLLQGETVAQAFGLSFGSVGTVKVGVPQSQAEAAKAIVNITEN
jgi:hypothetical protein